MSPISFTKIAALSAAAATLVESAVINKKRDSLTPLPENASNAELKYQPVMDFDTDSCYNTGAIDPDGNLNPGLQNDQTGVTENCDQVNRLWNSNVYSRERCNNGVCAYMYDYYFEKDVVASDVPADGGHRHDWENVVVFVEGDVVKMVAASCHDEYHNWSDDPWMWEGTHPKVVYHKDGASTHCIRMANGDDDPVENETGDWYRSALVGWNGWPSDQLFWDMVNNWPGGVSPKFDDVADIDGQDFGSELEKAQGSWFPNFDPFADE